MPPICPNFLFLFSSYPLIQRPPITNLQDISCSRICDTTISNTQLLASFCSLLITSVYIRSRNPPPIQPQPQSLKLIHNLRNLNNSSIVLNPDPVLPSYSCKLTLPTKTPQIPVSRPNLLSSPSSLSLAYL